MNKVDLYIKRKKENTGNDLFIKSSFVFVSLVLFYFILSFSNLFLKNLNDPFSFIFSLVCSFFFCFFLISKLVPELFFYFFVSVLFVCFSTFIGLIDGILIYSSFLIIPIVYFGYKCYKNKIYKDIEKNDLENIYQSILNNENNVLDYLINKVNLSDDENLLLKKISEEKLGKLTEKEKLSKIMAHKNFKDIENF